MPIKMMELPSLVLILREVRRPMNGGASCEFLALFGVEATARNLRYKFTITKDPINLLMGGRLQRDREIRVWPAIEIVQGPGVANVLGEQPFSTEMEFCSPILGTIPVLRLRNPCQALCDIYTGLPLDRYADYRIPIHMNTTYTEAHFQSVTTPTQQRMEGGGTGDSTEHYSLTDFMDFTDVTIPATPPRAPRMVTEAAAPRAKAKKAPACLPKHIATMMAKGLIAEGKHCPVTLDPLTMDNIRITPCGHELSVDGAECFSRKQECPTCRAKCSKEDLQTAI